MFLVTVSHKIQFTTINHVARRSVVNVMTELTKVFGMFKRRGFCVKHIRFDPEFNPIRDELTALGMTHNEVAA